MSASDDAWDWRFTDAAEREYEKLEPHERERIVSKLDEIVTDQWREPGEYLEPLTGAPHSKLRIGALRLGCEVDQSDRLLWILPSRSVRAHTNRATIDRPAGNGVDLLRSRLAGCVFAGDCFVTGGPSFTGNPISPEKTFSQARSSTSWPITSRFRIRSVLDFVREEGVIQRSAHVFFAPTIFSVKAVELAIEAEVTALA